MCADFIKRLSIIVCIALAYTYLPASGNDSPRTIFSGLHGNHHVQGIAVDKDRGYIYFSFTTKLIKADLQGRLIGSVDGLTGHLGCIAMNPADGRIYGSLEYKNDAIGKALQARARKTVRVRSI